MKFENTKEKILVDVLGVNTFNNIRNFFQAIEYSDSEYLVYISKKCYALFREFMPFLKLSPEKIRCTDVRIPYIMKDIKWKNVAIIDDILIHGRTLTSIRKRLEQCECKLRICVLAVNEESKKDLVRNVTEEIANNWDELKQTAISCKSIYTCDEYLWRKLSDLVMRSFWATNTPYTGYLPVAEINDNIADIIKSSDRVCYYQSCQNHSCQAMGLLIEYYYLRSFEENKNDYNVIQYFSMSMHRNSVTKTNILIPIIVLNDDLCNSKEALKEILNIVFSSDKKTIYEFLSFDKVLENDLITVSSIKFVMYLLSRVMLSYFIQEIGIDENRIIIDNSNLEYSFGKNIKDFVETVEFKYIKLNQIQRTLVSGKRLILEKWDSYIKSSFKLNTKKKLQDSGFVRDNSNKVKETLSDLLITAAENVKDLYAKYSGYENQKLASYVFARFLKKNSLLDERELYNNRYRLLGLEVSKMLQLVGGHTDFKDNDILTAFFSQFFLGASTIIVDKEKTSNRYGVYCHAGEQSYKCVVHEFVPLVYFSYRYNYNFMKDVAEKMKECILELSVSNYSYFNIPFSLDDFNEYSFHDSENIYDTHSIKDYFKEDSSRILCEMGFLLEEYISKTQYASEAQTQDLLFLFLQYVSKNMSRFHHVDRKYINDIFFKKGESVNSIKYKQRIKTKDKNKG